MFDEYRIVPVGLAIAVLIAIVLPMVGCASSSGRVDRASQLAARAEAANNAFILGDMRRWYEIVAPISQDFTLMQPFGGVSRGFDPSDAHLDQMARYFTGGEATFELIETYESADMVVLVFIERQTATVGGLPLQDWSLRVTQVYRRDGADWSLVHRHADAQVENVGLEHTAELARVG